MLAFQRICLHLAIWSVFFSGFDIFSEAVHITSLHDPITAQDSDCMVVLPCDFKTRTYQTPQISWYQERTDGSTLIMRYDIYNNLQSFGEFLNRVARGDAGALVVFRPTSRDSGNYTCVVEVDNENPSWTKSTVVLNVIKVPLTTEASTPEVVHITSFVDPIIAKDSDSIVVLPCDFTTDMCEKAQITWYQERADGRRMITKYNIKNRLSSYGEFADRVARGDSGALVLFDPKSRDSGNYTCEVEVENEIPSWTKSTVILKVSEVPVEKETPCPKSEVALKGLIPAVVLFWVIAFICTFMFAKRGITLKRDNWETLMAALRKQPFSVLKMSLFTLSHSLVIAGLVCIAYALSSTTREAIQRYERMGLIIGITGILGLLGTIIVPTCLPAALRALKTKRRDDGDRSTTPEQQRRMTGDGRTEEEEEAIGLSETFSSATDVSVETQPSAETSALLSPTREESEIKTLPGPPESAITGIVATSVKDLYVSTAKALFHLDISENGVKGSYTETRKFRNEILMIGKSSDDILMCGKHKKTGLSAITGSTEQHCILIIRLSDTSDEGVSRILVKNPLSWVYNGRGESSLYATDLMEGKVVVFNTIGEKQEVIGEGILQNPQCVVQNSDGQLIVADVTKNDIFVFDHRGEFLNSMKITLPKNLENESDGCNRLAVGPDDKIYASSPFSRNIVVFSSDLRFEKLLPLGRERHDSISSLLVHNDSLYVAHKDCIRIYPLKTS